MIFKSDFSTKRNSIFILNILVFSFGILLNLIGFLGNDYWLDGVKIQIARNIFISVGCSLIATAIVTFFYSKYQNRIDRMRELVYTWGLENIYETRAIMNEVADKKQLVAKKSLDAIGFGFSSWRLHKNSEVIAMLKRGVKIRILSPSPDSPFLDQRDLDEDEEQGRTASTIRHLEHWVQDLSSYGDIELRHYTALPLDFYFRIDDTLFIGPYMYKQQSQHTVSYEFSKNGKMYSDYTEYFEKIWEVAEPFQF